MSDEYQDDIDLGEQSEPYPECPKCDAMMLPSGSYVYDVVHTDRHEVSDVTVWICPNCGYKMETSEDLRSYWF